MIRNLYKILLSTLALGLLLTATGVSTVKAQEETSEIGLEKVWVNVYPEYDDPRLLVWMGGNIVGVEPPVTLSFLIPTGAQINATASEDALGLYTGEPPNRKASSIPGWDEISFEVTTRTFRVEYYDDIIIGIDDKTISYESRWLYPVSDLIIKAIEPDLSSDYVISPEGSIYTDDSDFITHEYRFIEPDIDEPLQFEISYTKSDPRPSLTINSRGTSTIPGSSGSIVEPESGISDLLVVVIILVVLGAGGIGWFLLTRKPKPRTHSEMRRAARKGPVKESGEQSGGKFCTQCGEPTETSDKFCASCGSEIS